MSERDFLRGLGFEIAQLRHAYAHLSAERVVKQREFADGLIAPAIRFLERVYADAADQRLPASGMEARGNEVPSRSDDSPTAESGDAPEEGR